MRWIFTIITIGTLAGFLSVAQPAYADVPAGQDTLKFLDAAAKKAQLTDATPSGDKFAESKVLNIVGNIINIVLGLVGILFFIQLFIAGFKWMSSGGNEEVVTESKKTIKSAVIGIVIVFSAFLVTNFVLNQAKNLSSTGAPGTPVLPIETEDLPSGTPTPINERPHRPDNYDNIMIGSCTYATIGRCDEFLDGITKGHKNNITRYACSQLAVENECPFWYFGFELTDPVDIESDYSDEPNPAS